MARLPYLEPATGAGEAREILGRLPLKLNIFKLMAHAETCFRPMLQLGTAILSQQKLDGRLRELAILHTAKLSRAEYEWVQHVPIAKMVGCSDEEIAALDRGEINASCFDAQTAAVLRFTDAVIREVQIDDLTYTAVASQLSHQEVMELIVAVGFYMLMARIMEATRIDLDPPAGDKILAGLKP